MMPPLLEVRDLHVKLGARTIVQHVDFEIAAGETLGLVGESGCGKTTIARAILRLVPAQGRVAWNGVDLLSLSGAKMRAIRRDLGIVFQNPVASLDPRMRIGTSIAEPLEIFEPQLGARARRGRVDAMLERVGLAGAHFDRYPHEFSGGQCQRIGIARAMILQPRLLVCDEPVSSLDVSIQGQIINLLADLQSGTAMAMLFISHNLAVVRHLCHRIMVMHQGRVVETADTAALFSAPRHPHTQTLLAASMGNPLSLAP
jgi:oligopeptide transport system ATP-binding protein